MTRANIDTESRVTKFLLSWKFGDIDCVASSALLRSIRSLIRDSAKALGTGRFLGRFSGIIWRGIGPTGDIAVHVFPMRDTTVTIRSAVGKSLGGEDVHPDGGDATWWDSPCLRIFKVWRDQTITGRLTEYPRRPVE
jgi:hypothetical protein